MKGIFTETIASHEGAIEEKILDIEIRTEGKLQQRADEAAGPKAIFFFLQRLVPLPSGRRAPSRGGLTFSAPHREASGRCPSLP